MECEYHECTEIYILSLKKELYIYLPVLFYWKRPLECTFSLVHVHFCLQLVYLRQQVIHLRF